MKVSTERRLLLLERSLAALNGNDMSKLFFTRIFHLSGTCSDSAANWFKKLKDK